jgi:hypothetical protein
MEDLSAPVAGTMASRRDCENSRSTSRAVLKAVPSDSCGSEPWAGPAACTSAAPFLESSVEDSEFGTDSTNIPLYWTDVVVGFCPITQSSSSPIVRFDAMNRLLFAL